MKKLVTNIMATTGITLVILSIIGTLYGARFLFISSVFQSLLACTIIHLGFIITRKFESDYFIVEAMLDITFVLIVLIISGFLFRWFASNPLWVVILMGVGIYLIGCLINIMRWQEDLKYINTQLQKRKLR